MNTTTVNVTIDYLVKLAVEPVEVTYDDVSTVSLSVCMYM